MPHPLKAIRLKTVQTKERIRGEKMTKEPIKVIKWEGKKEIWRLYNRSEAKWSFNPVIFWDIETNNHSHIRPISILLPEKNGETHESKGKTHLTQKRHKYIIFKYKYQGVNVFALHIQDRKINNQPKTQDRTRRTRYCSLISTFFLLYCDCSK